MKERVALYLQDAHDLRDGLDYVQYAEKRGFEAVWQAESRLVRDAIVPMAAYAAVTQKLKVGSGVINNWTRNIGLLAATFLTLDDLAPGRIICGIGAWWDPLAKNVGINRSKTADRDERDGFDLKAITEYGERHLPRRISTCRWDRIRCRSRTQGTAKCPDHDRCDRGPDDGNDRRDRRWRSLELLCSTGVQFESIRITGKRRNQGWQNSG